MRNRPLAFLLLLLGAASLAPAQATLAGSDRTLATAIDLLQAGDPQGALRLLQPLRERRDAPAAAFDLLEALSDAIGLAGGSPPAPTGERLREASIVRYVARAEALFLRRRPQEAIDILPFVPEAANGVDPDRLRRVAGRAALLAGRLPEAVRWLTPAAPGHPATTLALAQAHYRSGQAAESLALLAPLVNEIVTASGPPSNPRLAVSILVEHARITSSSGKPAEAVPALERASALAPESAFVWQALAQALLASGRRDEGERALARFRELSPAAAGQVAAGGATVTQAGKEALEEQQRAVEAAIEKAVALAKSGRHEEALKVAREQIRATPAAIEPRLLVITLLVAQNRLDDALAAGDETLAAFPHDPEARYHRAVVRLRKGQTTEAERDLRATLEVAPTHVLALNNLAVLLDQRQETAEAIKMLERVLAFDVENTVARENLARLREKTAPPKTPG